MHPGRFPGGVVLGTSIQEEAAGTPRMRMILHLRWLWNAWVLPEDLVEVSTERSVRATVLLLPPQATKAEHFRETYTC